MNLTLIKPGEDVANAVHIDFVGDGVLLVTVGVNPPEPHYTESNQEAKELAIKLASGYLRHGYRVYTGDGVTS